MKERNIQIVFLKRKGDNAKERGENLIVKFHINEINKKKNLD